MTEIWSATSFEVGQQSLKDFQVVPPSRGIVHQVNLEFLASVARQEDGVWLADTLVGQILTLL